MKIEFHSECYRMWKHITECYSTYRNVEAYYGIQNHITECGNMQRNVESITECGSVLKAHYGMKKHIRIILRNSEAYNGM